MRRIPVYFIVDVTAKNLKDLWSSLLMRLLMRMRSNPWLLETCYMSFLTHNNKSLIEKTRLADIASINIDNVLCSVKEAQKEIVNDTQGKFHYTQQERERLKVLLTEVINVDFIRTTADFKGDWMPMIIDINNEKIGIEILENYKESIEFIYGLDDWTILAAYIEYVINVFYAAHSVDFEDLMPFSTFKYNKNNHI